MEKYIQRETYLRQLIAPYTDDKGIRFMGIFHFLLSGI